MIEAEKFLNEVFALNIKINAKQKEIDILNSLLYKLNRELTPDKIQTSKEPDPMASTIVKLIDAREEINNLIDEYIDKLSEVKQVIEQVTDPKEYDLLHKHYIENMSWTKIAIEWDNSNTWVHEVKRNAFSSVQKILDEKAI